MHELELPVGHLRHRITAPDAKTSRRTVEHVLIVASILQSTTVQPDSNCGANQANSPKNLTVGFCTKTDKLRAVEFGKSRGSSSASHELHGAPYPSAFPHTNTETNVTIHLTTQNALGSGSLVTAVAAAKAAHVFRGRHESTAHFLARVLGEVKRNL